MSGRPPRCGSSCPSRWARTRPRRGGSGATGWTPGARWSGARRRRAATCWPGAAGTWRCPAIPWPSRRALGAAEPDGHGLTALPFLAGERSPGWRPEARAAVTGLSLDTGAVEIARALLESVAFRLAEVYDRLRPLAAADHVVVGSGGALAHSPAWAQIVTDALGVPVALGGDAEASARGAALLALEALGVAVPEAPAPLRVLQPAPERHARYRAARERQRLLYDNIVGFNAVLRE